jgi:hypothetical protein
MPAGDQLSLAVGTSQNRNLFPVHFLERRLPEWPEYQSLNTTALLAALSDIWQRERELLPTFNEEQTEDRWIRPILASLGFSYTARPKLAIDGRRREPDYALFLDEGGRAESERATGVQRYHRAVALVEAKRFDRPLDRRQAGSSLSEDPVAQIIYYVSTTRVPFGILTNGRIWRLYAQQGDLVEGAYYQVDLIALLESGDDRALRSFAGFFSAQAFRPDENGLSFLDRALAESQASAIEVGDKLQLQVFAAVPSVAQGLLGEDARSEENLANALENALVFLYRVLFCLHAEARRLLPIDSPHYLEYSVRKQRQELEAAIERGQVFSDASDRLYNELEALFKLVALGDRALGVNEYNGDLFAAVQHPWLRGRVVPDSLLAPALDGLYRTDGQAIDYRDLSVRQLGTIYERLLAYRLVETADGGLELAEAPGRRESGSYFTPEPIVDLIVEKTLEPLLEKRSSEIAVRNLRGKRALDGFLELKVVDPAMGSGHFLVSAASYMAKFIATDPSYDGGLEWQEIARLVAERCIYGVDLNPMAVELARLSLWLSTVRSDVPLTFLSNLRVGNSLVGADLDDLLTSDVSLFAERLARDAEDLLARTAEVAAIESSTGDKVHEKERLAASAEALRRPLHEYADDSIAKYFSVSTPMFHWEIEFPEVFLAKDGSLRSDRGFDAVVGNPPYIRIQSLDRELARWCRDRYEVAFGSFDAYIVFIERAVGLLSPGGRLGFIVPNKFLKLDAGRKLREQLAEARLTEEIIDFADTQVFDGATNYTSILVLDTRGHDELAYRRVRGEGPGMPTVREIEGEDPEKFAAADLDGKPWVLVAGEQRRLIDAISRDSVPLSKVAKSIFTGLQTSADPIYILEDRGLRSDGRHVYSRASERELVLEPDLLHPLASGAEVDRYAFKPMRSLLLFPYVRAESGMRLLMEAELDALPSTAAYLRSHEEALRGREKGKMDRPEWFGYVYPKSLGSHDLPKLGVPRLCERLRASIDPDGTVYLDNVDVNGILPSEGGPSIWTLSVLLNSKLIDFVFRLNSVPFRGSFYSANKQFIAPLPIRIPADEAAFVSLGRFLHGAVTELLEERDGFLLWLSDAIGAPIDSLAGRTKLDRPDALTPGELLEVLGRNRNRLSVDPSGRNFRERLAIEHASSVEKIGALATAIGHAEEEADAAVFELYELNDSRQALVESGLL